MLVAKGSASKFVLEGGRVVSAPHGSAMLHDPTGRTWGKCSVLFVSFRRGTREATPKEAEGAPRHYLGKTHTIKVGVVDVPPRALSGWEKIGPVKEIRYVRSGKKAPGGYFHPFGKRSLTSFFQADKLPLLYRRGSAMRLELRGSCVVDDRGFVRP